MNNDTMPDTPSSEELIERVLKENADMRRPDGSYILAEAELARRLQAQIAGHAATAKRLADTEKALEEADAALLDFEEGWPVPVENSFNQPCLSD